MNKIFINCFFISTFFLFIPVFIISSDKSYATKEDLDCLGKRIKEEVEFVGKKIDFLWDMKKGGTNIYNENHAKADGGSSNVSQNTNASANSSAAAVAAAKCANEKNDHYVDIAYEKMLKYWECLNKKSLTCFDSLCNHKGKVILSSIATGYVYLVYQLYKVNLILQNPLSWTNWKPTISMQQLVCCKHEELLPSLITDIQKKYLLSSKKAFKNDNLFQLDFFIKDIFYEQNMLLKYLSIQKYAKSCYVSKLFCFPYKKSYIKEKLNRLNVVLEIFIDWQTNDLLKK